MSLRLRRVVLFALVLASLSAASLSVRAADTITILPGDHEALLHEAGFQIWTRQPGFVIGSGSEAVLAQLSARGIAPLQQVTDAGSFLYLLHHREDFAPPSVAGATVYALSPELALYVFATGAAVDLPHLRPKAAFQAIPRIALPPRQPHPADLTPSAPGNDAVNPLVADILSRTSQATWFQTVKDLSGENPVVIGGQTWTISTRYTDAMFPTVADNAHATEYLEDRGAQWGYSSHRETYTSAESGCSQSPSWQNLIFIVPGQVDFGKHQQVLFINHYDSLSENSFAYAPGADDAISGGVALLEAMRTFKDFAFKNTLVFGWYTGEEEGICGSGAYTRQHPSVDMWRVVNMDQTAFDGDGNRLMDVYNWDIKNSPGSVALGDAFVQANSDYGNIIPPANIVRDTSKMCQTDHCPFWDVGVAAIAVTEDLHNNDICPCFDSSQTATCHDTVTQIYNGQLMFTPEYSWPSQKAAIAVIAQLAEPLYACPAQAVALPGVVAKNNAVALTWGAAPGVTNYVVERAATCNGTFEGVASVTGTSFEDINVVNNTGYAYRIRTCPAQVSECVTATPQASASVEYLEGSAVITGDSGDHDNIADDCELATLQLSLVNDGNVPLTNVRLAAVTALNPKTRVASAVPQLVGALGVGASAPVSFKFYVGRNGGAVSCGEAMSFSVTATSDQSPPSVRSFTVTAERSTVNGPLVYTFDGDYSGWTVTNGTFTRSSGGAPGSTLGSLHSGNSLDDCNAVQSPILKPTATSTISMWVNYGIESGSGDRANLRVVNPLTNEKTLLTPTGATYNTNGGRNLLCDNMGNIQGWSGSFRTWRQANFDLSAFAGREVKLEARYSTDDFFNGPQGFWMDNVQVSNATQINCDTQSNSCAALPPEVSPIGAAVPFTVAKAGSNLTLKFSESSGATKYNVYPGSLQNLQRGLYDHAAAPGLCGFTDASSGDGSVTVTVPSANVAAESYLLVAAVNAAGESVYGTATGGVEVPLALNSCP